MFEPGDRFSKVTDLVNPSVPFDTQWGSRSAARAFWVKTHRSGDGERKAEVPPTTESLRATRDPLSANNGRTF
jgi:hypothetical protein